MYPPDPDEATNVSNENNFSSYAAFKALFWILDTFYIGNGDQVLNDAKTTVTKIIAGLDHWFDNYLLPAQISGKEVISQGGHVTFDGQYKYQQGSQAFAVDCQTWGLLVYGQKRFDKNYGSKVTAYQVWQNAKDLSGYYIGGQLAGVGYTSGGSNSSKPDIWSGEWTWGAVFMVRKLAAEYRAAGRADYATSLEADAASMVAFMKKQVVTCEDDPVWCSGGLVLPDGAYLYANKRFFIPWGWYANPIGAASSTAWAVCDDWNYNPFWLGGGANTTFWTQQCKNNAPTEGILQKLLTYYNN